MADLAKEIASIEYEIEGYKKELRTAIFPTEKNDILDLIESRSAVLFTLMDQRAEAYRRESKKKLEEGIYWLSFHFSF